MRLSTTEDLNEFIAGPRAPIELHLGEAEQMEEEWFLGLRLAEGVRLATLREKYGRDSVDHFLPILGELITQELLEEHSGSVRLTSRGRLISNDVFARFLTAESEDPLPTKMITVI